MYVILSVFVVFVGGFFVLLFSFYELVYCFVVFSVFRWGVGVWVMMDVWVVGFVGLGYWVMVMLCVEDVL